MSDEDWADPDRRSIGMLLLGQAADEVDIRGRSASGDTLLLAAERREDRSRALHAAPDGAAPGRWEELLNTARPGPWRAWCETTSST